MALLGWSLILASVVYVVLRRPPLVDTLLALWRRSPTIQQPPSTRRPPVIDDETPARGHSTAISGAAASSAPSVSIREPSSSHADTPTLVIGSSPSSSPHTTPKARPNSNVNPSIPPLPLPPSKVDPPASAAALARAAPPTLSSPSISMSMPPPPRPQTRNNNPIGPGSSSLSVPPSRSSSSLLPNRSPTQQYDRQPGSSTLAPPPTHSSKPNKPSRKVTLEPGHSPLDWARLANHPTSDLRGLGPGAPAGYLRVTPSMLARQTGRRGKDAWTALGGRVYNISPYLPFHPGGEPELLRCAARDGTKLFGEIHPWVNYETMLSSCLIGLLVDEDEAQSTGEMEAMD